MASVRAVLVAVAGAAGALTRWGIASAVGRVRFPWGTLGINVVGSFLLGFLLATAPRRLSEEATLALGVGFLGAFTTFSTFSHETAGLLRDDRLAAAAAYAVASVVAGVLAAGLGWWSGRRLAA